MDRATVNELTCRQALAMVAEYLDRELGARESGQLERHIDTCRHCFDRVEFERLLKARFAQLHWTQPAEPLLKRIDHILDMY